MLISGVTKSLTKDLTIEVNAAPITMPTARSTTLPRRMKLRNPERSSRRTPLRTAPPIRSIWSGSLMAAGYSPPLGDGDAAVHGDRLAGHVTARAGHQPHQRRR